jgi:glycosyltransferase involved in cell wall biosynthesis
MTALRVLHVIEGMHTGGAESLIVEHVRHAGPGVQSLVCGLNRGGPAMDAAVAAGARGLVLEKGDGRLHGLRRLAAWMRDQRVDVVNGHNPTGSLYGTLAGRLAGVSAVFRTEHSIHYPGRHSGLYARVLEPALTGASDRVVCVCEAVRQSHAPRFPWAARRFVTVVNGVPDAAPGRPRDAVRRELELEPGDRVALTIGSLTPQKAQHVMLDAFADVARRVPEARLVIVGDGPLRATLERRAAELALGWAVRFLGARHDVADLLSAADVFALSSVREGLPVTLLECMRAGRPAVVSRVGGNAEAVADGETGRVVPVGDPAAFAEALTELLADRERARAWGALARERWARRFTAERMVRETEALYREVLGARRAVARDREASHVLA